MHTHNETFYKVYLISGGKEVLQMKARDEGEATSFAARHQHVVFPSEKLEIRRVTETLVHTLSGVART